MRKNANETTTLGLTYNKDTHPISTRFVGRAVIQAREKGIKHHLIHRKLSNGMRMVQFEGTEAEISSIVNGLKTSN